MTWDCSREPIRKHVIVACVSDAVIIIWLLDWTIIDSKGNYMSFAVFWKISAKFFSSPGMISLRKSSLFSLMNWLPICPRFGSPLNKFLRFSRFLPLIRIEKKQLALVVRLTQWSSLPIWIFKLNFSNLKYASPFFWYFVDRSFTLARQFSKVPSMSPKFKAFEWLLYNSLKLSHLFLECRALKLMKAKV